MTTDTTPTAQHPPTLSMADACRYAGRSRKTIRRWITAGHVKAERVGTGHNAPLTVDTLSLRAHLSILVGPGADPTLPMDTAPTAQPPTPTSAAPPSPDMVATLREQLADLRGERDRLLGELERTLEQTRHDATLHREDLARARREIDRLREDLAGERQARAAVERAAAEKAAEASNRPAGGVRGLLGRWLG